MSSSMIPSIMFLNFLNRLPCCKDLVNRYTIMSASVVRQCLTQLSFCLILSVMNDEEVSDLHVFGFFATWESSIVYAVIEWYYCCLGVEHGRAMCLLIVLLQSSRTQMFWWLFTNWHHSCVCWDDCLDLTLCKRCAYNSCSHCFIDTIIPLCVYMHYIDPITILETGSFPDCFQNQMKVYHSLQVHNLVLLSLLVIMFIRFL